jgi:hypothetical protein
MRDSIAAFVAFVILGAGCTSAPTVKYDETSDGIRMVLHTGSSLDVWTKCHELDPEIPAFDAQVPHVCIQFDEPRQTCDVYSPDPVDDQEWSNERHVCKELAKDWIKGMRT